MAVANITEILDTRNLSSFQTAIFGLCGAIVFCEGFNAQLAGYVVPALAQAWQVRPAALTPFIVAGLAGLTLGSLLVAPLADKFGRRPLLIGCVALFGICSIATAASTTPTMLDITRFLTGIGIGGAMPNAIALTAEYSPNARRHVMVAIIMTGFVVGAIVVGVASAALIPSSGWQSVPLAGGVLSLLLVPVLLVSLPESVRFLVTRGAPSEKIGRLLTRIDPTIQVDSETRFVLEDGHRGDSIMARLGLLFSEGRARLTVLIWIVYFMSLLNLFLMANWLPTHMRAIGVPLQLALLIPVLLQVGGLVGVSFGWMLDKQGASATFFTAYFLAAISIACIALVGDNLLLLALSVFGAGFGIIGGQNTINAYAAGVYPTHIRSTGVGWATGIGRIGSIVGPTVAGILLEMDVSSNHIFFLAVGPALIASAAGAALGGRRILAAKAA